MISNDNQEKLLERLLQRIETMNEEILKVIGEKIGEIGKISPTDVHRLKQMILYGEDLSKITEIIAKYTGLNEKEIYKIFEEEAKINQSFAKQYYKAKNIEFIPYDKNKNLQNLVDGIAKTTADTYKNISKTMGFGMRAPNGKIIFTPLAQAYQKIIDDSILAISTGQTTYQQTMRNVIKQLGRSGIRSVDFATGYHRRIDTQVRMNTLDGMRELTNNLQQQFGEEFGADGVEISVHSNPAPDHSLIQGHQFSLKEYENMQNSLPFVDYEGNSYNAIKRHISQWNCYHYIFNIVLGVNKPLFNDKQLEEINNTNEKGFEFEGKHYTNYEGTQLQRQIETEIRKNKDTQILAKASGDLELVNESQMKITQLTNKYNKLNRISGLKSKMERARVSGYRRTNV